MTNENQKPAAAATDQRGPLQADANKASATAMPSHEEKVSKLKAEIKKTWDKLTDEEISFYDGKQNQFFDKVKEKYSLSREDAQKRLKEIEASCSSCVSDKAA